MRFIKFTIIIILVSIFFTACNSSQSDETIYTTPYPNNPTQIRTDEDYYVRDNLELQVVGELLEKSNNAEDFEFRLNSNNNVNNLDLNGDGYADYISVAEYEDRNSNQCGFTLYDRFGQNDIQEIARIIFDRDRNDNRGARVLIYGNEQIYGDNYYYQTNWLDKSLTITEWAFSNRNSSYQSPYYYDNYPNDYEAYRIVETPVYRTRIRELYPEEIFVRATIPIISRINIRSSYNNKSDDKIFGKLAKPTKGQDDFRKNNPNKPEFVMAKERTKKEASSRSEKEIEKVTNDSKKTSNNKNEKIKIQNQPNKVENKSQKVNVRNEIRVQPKKVENETKKIKSPNKNRIKSNKAEKPNKKVEKSNKKVEKPNKKVIKPSKNPVKSNKSKNKKEKVNKPKKNDNKGKKDKPAKIKHFNN